MTQIKQNSIAGVHEQDQQELTPLESVAVGKRQDDLMAIESPEGRPPEHQASEHGWRSMAIAMPLLALIAVVWAMVEGVSTYSVIGFAAAGLLVLLIGAWPVLGAVFLRGKEESVARNEALSERHSDKLPR